MIIYKEQVEVSNIFGGSDELKTYTMEETAWEDIQLDVEERLFRLSQPRLEHLAVFLDVDVQLAAKRGRLHVAKCLQKALEKIVDKQEDKLTFLKDVLDCVEQGDQDAMGQSTTTTEDAAGTQKSIEKDKETVSTPSLFNNVESLLRREFKINGSIGGEKDKLSYVGLMRQIDGGLAKGYKEIEVTDAVIRAINSSSKLKSYLEIISDITLPKLCQILRVHFQEKTASELYQELQSIVQSPKENAQDFLLRALSLRERILFASKAEETGLKYDARLVYNLFTHAFETGLREESIRTKIRDVLHCKEGCSDENLMESLNKIVSIEEERQNKFRASQSKNTREPRVNSHSTGNTDETPKRQGNHNDNSRLLSTIEALQAQVADLSTRFENQRESTNIQHSAPRFRKRCQSCQNNNVNQCNHCFKCGSTDHMARSCKTPSGNGNKLLSRDRK